MQNNNLLREEKKKLLNLLNHEYVKIDFSKLTSILDNNCDEPRWMDVYVLLYEAKLPADITIYNILLEKLSKQLLLFYYKDGKDRYLANANEFMLKQYVYYLISGDRTEYNIRAQYIPNKEYIKEILKISKFSECGMNIKHVSKDKFIIDGLEICFENVDEARKLYDDLLDVNDFHKNVNIDRKTLKDNYEDILILGKDKRMLASISNICTYFRCKFDFENGYITVPGTNISMNTEETVTSFQAKLIDAYHFFRNVINTRDKKDIISEIYSGKLALDIKEEFEENLPIYLNVIKNKELIDWIVTISKESKYTLNIKFDEQGVFYIDDAIIVTALDAKEYYIDYMDKKNEKLAVAIYKNTIVTKIKRLWTKFRAKFVKV